MADREKLPDLKFKDLAEKLLQQIDTLVPMWLPGGHKEGHEYKCGDLFNGGKGRSVSVKLTTGEWSEFNGEIAGGDLISLYAAKHGLSNPKAAIELARDLGLEDVLGLVKGECQDFCV